MNNIAVLFADIFSIQWSLPYTVKLTIIIIIMFVLTAVYYVCHNSIEPQWQRAILWIYVIIMVNLVNIAVVILYNAKVRIVGGKRGGRGRRGQKGKEGKYISCSYCSTNLYIETDKKYDMISQLNLYKTANIKIQLTSIDYLSHIFANDNMDLGQVLSDIIYNNAAHRSSELRSKMESLLNVDGIRMLIYMELTTHSNAAPPAQIRRPLQNANGKIGFLPLGDSITNANERTLELNQFLVKGDIVYPTHLNKIVEYVAAEHVGDIDDEYASAASYDIASASIWSADPVIINGITYYPCGQLTSSSSSIMPALNSIALISENCLTPMLNIHDDLELVAVHFTSGNDASSKLFSIWRSPYNTMFVNVPVIYPHESVAYNIINGVSSLDEPIEKLVMRRLDTINVSRTFVIAVLVLNLQLISTDELAYYIAKHYSLSAQLSTKTLSELLAIINDKKAERAKYIKQGKIKKNSSAATPDMPYELIKNVAKIERDIGQLLFKVDKVRTLLDLVMEIFPLGINTQLATIASPEAVSSHPIHDTTTELQLNVAQREVLHYCQLLFPPNVELFEIKDECIGTYQRDKEKETAEREFTKALATFNNLMLLKKTQQNTNTSWELVEQYITRTMLKIGEYVGHISNYQDKLEKQQLQEFTTTKIQAITQQYNNIVKFIRGATQADTAP
jgi:hypothetical protein